MTRPDGQTVNPSVVAGAAAAAAAEQQHPEMKQSARPLLRVKTDELFLRWFTEEATMAVLRENLQQLLEGDSLAAMLAVTEPTPAAPPNPAGVPQSPRPQTPPHSTGAGGVGGGGGVGAGSVGGLRSYSPRSPRRQPSKNGGGGGVASPRRAGKTPASADDSKESPSSETAASAGPQHPQQHHHNQQQKRPLSESEDGAAGPVLSALLRMEEEQRRRPQDIPRFHFPAAGGGGGGGAAAPNDAAAAARLSQALDQLPGQSVTLAQMADIAKAMGYPKYWKQPLFSAAVAQPGVVTASKERLTALRRDLARNYRDDSARFVHLLTRGARTSLTEADFLPLVQDIVDSHPGLSFLQEAPEFHGRYVNTVIARIFYEVNASWSGRITCQELRKSRLLATIASLEVKDDINEVTDFFSYEHFYVIYCKFWDIDTDHDLFVSKEDLRRHNNYGRYLLQMPATSALALAFSLGIPALSDRIIDRIFSGAVCKSKSLAEGRMSYPEFVWFLLAEEDKRHPRSIEYWFRCMDLDGDGVISLFELEHFYTEQMRRMEEARIEEFQGLHDCVCTMLDMVKPAVQNRITLSDLKRCKMAHVFFDTMFNLHKFLEYEQRDPFANLRDIQEGGGMSDWEKYAAEMYEILVAEESNGALPDDAYPDDFENLDEESGGGGGGGGGSGGVGESFSRGDGLKFLESFKGSKEI